MEGDRGKGWGWKVAMVSMDDLDRDTGDGDSQSRGTNDEYFYDEVTGTLEAWVLRVGVGGGGYGGEGEGNHVLHRRRGQGHKGRELSPVAPMTSTSVTR